MAGLRRSCLGGDRRRHRHDLDLLRLGKVLMRRAVAVVVQGDALTGGAAAGGRAALQGVAVGVEPGARQAVERLLRAGHIALDDAPHAGPVVDVEVRPEVAEQRPRRAGEVVLVADHAFDRRLAGAKDRLMLLSTPGDAWRQLAVDRPTDLIHEPSRSPRALAPDPSGRGVCGAFMKRETWLVLSSG